MLVDKGISNKTANYLVNCMLILPYAKEDDT
jgi:hypothetical protein